MSSHLQLYEDEYSEENNTDHKRRDHVGGRPAIDVPGSQCINQQNEAS